MRQPPKESSQSLSYHIALGGIIAALCIACMFLTGVFPMFYLILPMLASAFIYAFCTTKLEDIDIKAWGEYK